MEIGFVLIVLSLVILLVHLEGDFDDLNYLEILVPDGLEFLSGIRTKILEEGFLFGFEILKFMDQRFTL